MSALSRTGHAARLLAAVVGIVSILLVVILPL
jgi:hypothetical protein